MTRPENPASVPTPRPSERSDEAEFEKVTSSGKRPKPKNALQEAILNPAARVYLMLAGTGLATLALTMFLVGSPLAAAILTLTGITAIVLRWTAMPVFTVFALAYLSFAPTGLPIDFGRISQIPGSSFDLSDLIVIGSALVYLVSLYRLYSLIQQGMPYETTGRMLRKEAVALLRPPTPITDVELARMFMRIGVVLLGGQLIWWFVTHFTVDFRRLPPLVLDEIDPLAGFRASQRNQPLPPGLSRFLLTASLFAGIVLVLRFVLWYWRLQTLNRDEARLILTDTIWSEHRRPLNRQETWRAAALPPTHHVRTKRERVGCVISLLLGLMITLMGLPCLCCMGLFRLRF